MSRYSDLKLEPIAIGSLPHNDTEKAMQLVEKDFKTIPFFPQLSNVSKNEDMVIQVLEGLPSFLPSKVENFFVSNESEEFFEGLEEFFLDYEEIMADPQSEKLEKYAISKDFSSTFPVLEAIVKRTKPKYAKGQIVGAFTLCTLLTDKTGKCVIYDETLREVVVKLLCLKVLWQIRRIKQANSQTVPVIFMDEPSLSQLGTSAYITVSQEDVFAMLTSIRQVIQSNGGICAIHCCGKCDWQLPIKVGVDIINCDGWSFGEHFSIYSKKIEDFLLSGGKIAWGIVPTLDSKVLAQVKLDDLVNKFENCVTYLTKKGIDEKLIIDNSLITSSCGAGSLSEELAQRAMDLVFELSQELKKRF